MKKVLWYGDFLCPTGFGTVAENILERLMPHFELEAMAINYKGEPYNKVGNPYYKFKNIPVYPAMRNGDIFGKNKLYDIIKNGKYDTVFILQDLFNLVDVSEEIARIRWKTGLRFVLYFPVDGPVQDEWKKAPRIADVAVAYTNWGKEQVGIEMPVIYHGVDKCYFPLGKEEVSKFRMDYFGIDDKTILVTNVNRNQPRKDLTKTIMAFSIFHDSHPDSVLYLHCDWNDGAGIDLHKFIKNNYPDLVKSIICPRSMLSKHAMNFVYNASDMLVSSTLGEGWGLSTVEAMACMTPVVIPDNTTATEIVGKDRGYIIDAGSSPSLWVCNNNDNNILRPTVDVEDMTRKMARVIEHPLEVEEFALNAKTWVTENCDWDKIAMQWKELL